MTPPNPTTQTHAPFSTPARLPKLRPARRSNGMEGIFVFGFDSATGQLSDNGDLVKFYADLGRSTK